MSELVDHAIEIFGPLGPVRARRMFGGYGLYRGEAMFGMVVDGVLFLKADEITTPLFKARGLTRFQYERNGKPVRMSFFAAPEDVFDDRDEAELWGRRALEAAERARARRGGRRSG